ncbi:Stk1 family PASTA domain-containing Ser/Thr kinase [Anaerococcus sp. mt242]|uniref:Stk1 family PASTA domain-containing Ser/Thr kinase n=1 Tax=Anaerococcus sp. mt242 TaxID=2661917 RepID=UPI0019342F6F|nr:Stk1 family PASTA domain-containing Ser/Thr kinase [Anaerococcus sp. mt242]MBM0045959.1 Stk1 family PASTA domain-containing Ser/Thr kinase [Anaerococcus sp. mt242]
MEKIILDDRYEIIEQIGVGGMAKVYKAKDKLLDRFVAIKILKDQYAEDIEFLKKFNNEAQSAAKLSHINIVNVFDIGEDLYKGERIYYIVMEYVNGQTLKDLIVKEGRLSNPDIIDYSVQIAQALKTAHQAGIIHRDIKPQNILIDNYGLLKVTDFGIARVSSNATITYTSSILGTVHYISPEQAKGKIVDEKSDLYSLGAVMYEMATGKVPFDADNSVGIAVMHIQDEPEPAKNLNPDLSDHLNYIIMKLLDKDPANRFLNAKELIDALEDQNFIQEEEDLTDTARIPIVVPQERSYQKVYNDQAQMERKEEEEKEEAVYVSNSDKKVKSKHKKPDKKIWPLLLLALVLVSAVYFLSGRANSKETIEVPMLLNLDQEQAVNELERRGLKANISRTEESDEYEIGKVMSQDPEQNTKVDRGTTVNLVISGGREVEVPDLRNMTLSQADETLKEVGLRLGRTNPQSSDNVEKDLILSQTPRSYSKLQAGSEVDVVVSTGPDQRVNTVEVPNLIGKSEQDAKAVINQYGLNLRDVKYQNSSSVEKGFVISQSIANGTQVANNSNIDLVVSLGAEEDTEEETPDQNQDQNTDTNGLRNVVLRVNLPEQKDQFKVMVFDIVDGQRNQAIINQTMTSADLNSDGRLILNVKARYGASLEVIVDDETLGVYKVE